MNSSVTVKVEFDAATLVAKYHSRGKAAQVVLDEMVLTDTDPYVRYRTGALARSAHTASHIGRGKVIYDTLYAKKVYYDKNGHVSRDVHPLATPFWFEESKKKNFKSWMAAVDKILKEGNR